MANATLDDLVLDIDVTLGAAAVDGASFDVMLIAGRNATFPERVNEYTALADVIDGTGITSSHPEYRAAREAFANGADRVLIGKLGARVAQVHTFEITTTADGVWTITIDGVDYTYTASGSAAASAVATGLRAAVNTTDVEITAAGSSAIITLTADIAGRGFTATITPPPATAGVASSTATTANVSVGDELDDVLNENAGWYVLVMATGAVDEDVLQAAAWVESDGRRIQIAQSSTAGILSASSTTDLAYVLEDRSYNRTSLWYHGSASTQDLAAALAGDALQADPDEEATTWAHRTLSGISTATISATQRSAALAKNCGVYLKLKGTGATYEGKMASGLFVDEVVSADWFRARLEEDVAQALLDASARNAKIPHTDAGYLVFESIVHDRFAQGVAANHFRDDTLVVEYPDRATVPSSDVTNRIFRLSGSVGLAGAVHSVSFNLTASAA